MRLSCRCVNVINANTTLGRKTFSDRFAAVGTIIKRVIQMTLLRCHYKVALKLGVKKSGKRAVLRDKSL